MKEQKVFLSYRREGGAELARLVRDALHERGHDVFMDVEDLRSGPFNTALLHEIEARPAFVVFLTPNSLERCGNPDDWLRLEIAHAIKHRRNIVPVRHKNFAWPAGQLPQEIAPLRNYQGLEPSHEFFEASMDKLSRLLGGSAGASAHREHSGKSALFWGGLAAFLLLAASAAGWMMFGGGKSPVPAASPKTTEVAAAPASGAMQAPAGSSSVAAAPTSSPTPSPAPQAPPQAASTPAPQAVASIASPVPAEGKNYEEDLGGGVKLEMVWIPGGTFLMGSPATEPDRTAAEGPQTEIKIAGFWMAKFEATQAQYAAIAGNNPAYFKVSGDYPVEMTSWGDATGFCAKLSAKTGKTYVLPSESQWEYACRAGSKGRWSFGDDPKDLPKNAWLLANSGDKGTHAVGGESPNAFGLYDMHGNVFEWCQDWYLASLAGIPADGSARNVQDPASPYRVLRGGGWHFDGSYARSAYRSGNLPESRFYTLGFRIARTE